MLLFAYYLLKVIVCSTVLYGYYWLFLRNKIFHSYNRFYLLATIILSLTFPLLKFNVWQKPDAPKIAVVKMLQVVNNSDAYMDEIIVQSRYNHITKEDIALWIFISICTVFAAMFITAIYKIYFLKKNNLQQQFDGIILVHTTDKKTPFSFLKNIFWNDEIDIYSNTGKRILKHELAHVHEKHSHDKLFINIILIVFWSNPIFWLIRKELNMIHEFIADKKAVENGDAEVFAAMILQSAYPGHRFELTNNFFYSPIKRRLSMLTKNKTKVSYISRLLVLPLTILVFAAFTLKAKTYIHTLPKNKIIRVVIDAGHGGSDNGAVATDGTLEKDLSLALAKKIMQLNQSGNIKILLVRDADIFQTPKEKAELAKKLGAELFISIHLNNAPATDATNQSGLTTWVAKNQFKNAVASKLFASSITAAFTENYQLPVASNPLQRETGIAILQATTCPTVLIEAGFLSNEKDLAYLKSIDGQEQFAKNILSAIFSYQNTIDPPAILKTTTKSFEPADINIGTNTAKGSVTVSANNKLLQEEKDYSIDYNQGIIKVLNKDIVNAAIPVQVSFKNNQAIMNDTIPDFKPLLQKIQNDIFIDASQVVSINNKENNFYAVTRLNADKQFLQPLIIINGLESTIKKLNEIDKSKFEYIRLLKPETATAIYGDKGKQGAIVLNVNTNYKLGPHATDYDLDHTYFTVGDLTNSNISSEEFKMQKNVTVATGLKFISSNVYFGGGGFETPSEATLTNTSLVSLRSLMDKCVNGTSVTFDNIEVKDEKGHTLFIASKSYNLTDKKTDPKLPTFSLSGISSPNINITSLSEITELKCSDNNYKIVRASAYFSAKGFPNIIVNYMNDGSLKSLENNMNKIVAGSRITFDNIRIAKKDGSDEMQIEGKSFLFYDKK